MAKRELDSPEAGTGDRVAYNPATTPTVTPTPTLTSATQEPKVGKDQLFKLIVARWPMFEKLAAETKGNKARRKFDGLWSELGRDIVDRGIVSLPQRNQKPGRAVEKKSKKKSKSKNKI